MVVKLAKLMISTLALAPEKVGGMNLHYKYDPDMAATFVG